jgi:hypothetical protein
MPTEKVSVSMRELVTAAAGPRLDTDTRESWLRRAANNAGASYRMAKALFYGEVTDPQSPTARKFKEAAGRHEARNLAAQFESLARSLDVRDSDFHSADIIALINAARALRGLDRAGNNGITNTGMEASWPSKKINPSSIT